MLNCNREFAVVPRGAFRQPEVWTWRGERVVGRPSSRVVLLKVLQVDGLSAIFKVLTYLRPPAAGQISIFKKVRGAALASK